MCLAVNLTKKGVTTIDISKFNMQDTIVGVSAPVGGAISIVRLSGANSTIILSKIFKHNGRKPFQSHRIYYGWIFDGKERIDEVLVSVMLAPKTFTCEDVVEINCHGGAIVVQRILSLVLRHGARAAQPGEFTRRAFLNGRIDLSRAEAVSDIINAKSELSHKAAAAQLQGRLAVLINATCETLLNLLARIEMAIDYPEYDEADIIAADVKTNLLDIQLQLAHLLKTANQGRIIRDGIKTVIIGRPNVGKSSLLNALAQENSAIVSHIPGTTRDVIRENIRLGDLFLVVSDTAGIRETDDIVESQGVERSVKEALQADLILLVLDGSEQTTRDDIAALDSDINNPQHVIVVINKADLPQAIDTTMLDEMFGENAVVYISAKNYEGIDTLTNKIRETFFEGKLEYDASMDIVTRSRHIALLHSAADAITRAIDAVDSGMSIDLLAIDIQDAYASLGEITGVVIEDALIDKIFSEFCLGK